MKQCLTNVEKISKLHRNVACHSSQPLHTVIYHAEVTEVRRKCIYIYIYSHSRQLRNKWQLHYTSSVLYCCMYHQLLNPHLMLSCCILPLFKEPPIECGKAKTVTLTFSPCQEHPRSAAPWQQGSCHPSAAKNHLRLWGCNFIHFDWFLTCWLAVCAYRHHMYKEFISNINNQNNVHYVPG